MIFLFIGIIIGVIILLKIGRKDPQIKEKKDDDVSENQAKQETQKSETDFMPKDINFSQEEIKRRQEKVLSNLNESERKLFVNYVQEHLKTSKDPKKNSKDDASESVFNNLVNLLIIMGIGGLVYYYLQLK